MSAVPGLTARHAVVSDQCRDIHGDLGAFDEAVERLRETYVECLLGWKRQNIAGVKYHLVLSVERPER